MKLHEITGACTDLRCDRRDDPEIRMISTDSRQIERGGLFIAIEGYRENGLKYVQDALSRGAAAVVAEERFRAQIAGLGKVPVCYTGNARKCSLEIARVFFGHPSESFTLIGVTGTNGKTTVTYLLEAILRAWRANPGVIGTVSYRYNDVVRKAGNTTPDPVYTQSLFSEMNRGGVTHVVMEVSSHALAMDRIRPQDFDYALFTNLSQDHLDFHRDMEDYFSAKSSLFTGLRGDSVAVVNSDDAYGKRLLTMCAASVRTYGVSARADYRAVIENLDIRGSRFFVNGEEFDLRLAGEHNVYNFCAAYAVSKLLGVPDEAVRRALDGITGVPGRFERVDKGADYFVFVDYAHTPDALDHLLDAALRLKKGRIITVFGCGGDRDRKKRPIMGGIVERKSDIAIVTSDNPRSEDPLAIIGDIRKGMKGSRYLVIPDRREAIFKAIGLASKNDIVLIAGKGHEDYQIMRDRTIHFDDREVAREAMSGR
jgi:UDP-N-acetylmuramoyl-L-alanyl-D-glutamate--2,6-diaminopimelate ligase